MCKNKYKAYSLWADLFTDYIRERVRYYNMYFKTFISVEMGIIGSFIVFTFTNKAIISYSKYILALSVASYLISIVFIIIGLLKQPKIDVKAPTDPQLYEEDEQSIIYSYEEIGKLDSQLLQYLNSVNPVYKLSIWFFAAGFFTTILFYILNYISII